MILSLGKGLLWQSSSIQRCFRAGFWKWRRRKTSRCSFCSHCWTNGCRPFYRRLAIWASIHIAKKSNTIVALQGGYNKQGAAQSVFIKYFDSKYACCVRARFVRFRTAITLIPDLAWQGNTRNYRPSPWLHRQYRCWCPGNAFGAVSSTDTKILQAHTHARSSLKDRSLHSYT